MKKFILQSFVSITFGVIGAAGFHYFNSDDSETIPIRKESTSKDNQLVSSINSNLFPDFKAASSASTSSVVYIETVSKQGVRATSWLDLFFGMKGSDQRSIGSGSGVIVSKDGYIVTNRHVIERADGIEVVHKKRVYNAKIIGIDPSTDLALIKIDAEGLPAITFGSSSILEVGEWVLAVGNPFNLNSTVTAGIVSAKGRNIDILDGQFSIESFIQTDAAINPGNSGGALVNQKGELVGINTAILSKTGSYVGYGFAVPSDIVSKVIDDLKRYGHVQKAFLGADIQEVDQKLAEKLSLNEITGVAITRLDTEGAAEKAGLEEGDVITKINGHIVDSRADFDEQMSYYRPGDKVKIQWKHAGQIKETDIQLVNMNGVAEIYKKESYVSESLGATFEALSKIEKTKLRIESGVRISEIRKGMIAQLGIEEGFIVTDINNMIITSPEELSSTLEKVRGRVTIRGVDSKGVRGYYSFYF